MVARSRRPEPATANPAGTQDSERELDYRALAELRHQIRCFLTFSEREARTAGVEPQQHQLLLALKGLPEGRRPSISVLAERLQLKHHTTVGLVDRLVAAGLAQRRPSDEDGREILVHVSAQGERLLRKLSIAHRAELSSAGPTLVAALEEVLGHALEPASQRSRA
ncbi:MAG: MarR family winged helix-turn-helix transcriptional regulator [Polyangiales bacterium]